MVIKAIIAVAAVGLTMGVQSHMLISNPAPYSISQKSPLNADGSNWPCQAPSDYSQGTVANIASGSAQSLAFDLGDGANTAVHGGGSCQVSITYATDATSLKNPANWKVLHSWIGGCPVDAPGNLDTAKYCTSPGQDGCVRNMTYTMPAEAPNGKAIMAWTWFNNIGNREMYMNCFPATITGSQGTQDTLNTLPQIFTANIGSVSGGCATTENFNLNFPNPGKYATTDSPLNFPLKAPAGCSAGAGTGNGVAVAPSTPSSTGNAGTFAESPNTATAAVAAPTTLATQPAPAAATTAAAAPVASPSTVAPQVAPPASSGSGSCAAGQVTCSASGFYCIDSTHFGMCAFGCATPMAVAGGTSCTANAIGYAKTKRWSHIRHARSLFGL